jgi:HPt (histidine-containing phosphotransfer) domain-containing protein
MSTGDAVAPAGPAPDDGEAGRAALAMLRRVGGEGLVRDMAALFGEELPERLAAARAALAAADREALWRSAHTLRASCGQIGAAAAARLARELERRAAADDLPALAPLVDQVEGTSAAYRAWLARELAPEGAAP